MKPTLLLSGLIALAVSHTVLWAQGKDAVVIFKDGFSVKGKVVEKRDFITDPYTGASFTVPDSNAFLYVDDLVRRIHFSPAQVQDVLELKPEQLKEEMRLQKGFKTRRGEPMMTGYQIESVSDWNEKWERVVKVNTPGGRLKMDQRLAEVTPYSIYGVTVGYDWAFFHLTQEFDNPQGQRQVRALMQAWFADKPIKEPEKHLHMANFFRQAGWYDAADRELQTLVEKYPDQKEAVTEYLGKLRRMQGDQYVQELERMTKVGQHERAQERIEEFKKQDLTQFLSDKSRLLVQELKTKYEAMAAQLKQLRQHLKEFSNKTSDRALWSAACKVILEELDEDTLGRLETFAGFAQQHAKELQEGKKPTQKTEEVLALAVSGWLQGNSAAEPDPKAAAKLFRARETVLLYLRTDNLVARNQLLGTLTAKYNIPVDALIRMIRLLPPPQAYSEKLETTEPAKLSIDLPDSDGGSYYLQLPPEYHPTRPYPVIILLHSYREKADVMVRRWQFEAAKHGFILAAPVWAQKGLRPSYEYSLAEHRLVLDTLRDVRRKFNVDSDRVFLFGWEQGANAAFDIGMSHPDQFAGVLPMNGTVKAFPTRYWSNAQYLPFYIVEGDRNGNNPKFARSLFKDWIRGHYPSLYIEYKGRGSDWFSGELANMMDWMSRKKRHHPLKEMGRYHTGGGRGEEFKTMRTSDDRFYWLSTDDISAKHINTFASWSNQMEPATLQASASVGNEADKSGARIWTQFNIRTTGVKQVTLWLAPNQIDYAKPVIVRVNGQQVGGSRHIQPSVQTLLEQLYLSGDRQRLFVARIDLRL
jgi:hypothetical protein